MAEGLGKKTLAEFTETLIAAILDIGGVCGEDRELLELKAEKIREMMREIDRLPDASELVIRTPRRLKEIDVGNALRETSLASFSAAQRRLLGALIKALPELCTSILIKR